ncbi:MAG: monooxygenase FAD-binding protein, partial [Candidatus Binatus sp.]|nr:monooxygenase FAD-binding protein [Candidatus Binatus sp.]
MDRKHDVPAIVAGAGPTGLMMAAELARHGVECRIVDRMSAPSDKSRALGVQARTLELFDSIGIADQAVAAGHKVHGASAYANGKRILHLSFRQIDSRFPFILILPQSETEQLLNRHLTTLGIQVEREVEVVGFTQDSDGVTVTLKAADGREERCRSAWLLGCDGARSVVRHGLGVPFEGAEYQENFWLADVILEIDQPDDELRLSLGEDALLALFPMGDRHWRVMATSNSISNDAAPTLEQIQVLLDRRLGKTVTAHDPSWLSHFRIARRGASSLGSGRVFIAGDAAHVHSPAGGQGMNTGLQDASNLAWKLALANRGSAASGLLASYQAERHRVAMNVLRETDLMMRVVGLRNPIAQSIRNHLMPILFGLEVAKRRAARLISEISINYRRSPIVSEHRAGLISDVMHMGSGLRAGYRAPDAEPIQRDAAAGANRLYEAMRGPHFNLLIFAGLKSNGDLEDMHAIADAVRRRCGNAVRTHLVVLDAHERIAGDVNVILDP